MKNKSFIAKLLSNNFVLLIISFVLAFGAWFIINANSETETNVTISDIPITIELSDEAKEDGLQIFSGNDVTASVEVSGNRITVGSLTPSDILVSASGSTSIIAPNTYTLPLSVKKSGTKSNYNIVSSVSPSNITIYVDRLKETEFDIENDMVYQVADNYYASASLSESKVTLSGPESDINKIDTVSITGAIDGVLSSTQTVTKPLIYFDKDGNQLDLPLVTAEFSLVDVSLTVYPVVDVKLTVDVINAPSSYPNITISPETVKVSGPQASLNEMTNATLSVGTVDFQKLSNQNVSVSYDLSPPTGCKIISGVSAAQVSVDLSSNIRKTVSCKINSNLSADVYKTDFASTNVDIVVIGPEDLIEEISSSDITVTADFSEKLNELRASGTLSVEVPLTVKLSSDYDSCWIYGSYTANVNVSKK